MVFPNRACKLIWAGLVGLGLAFLGVSAVVSSWKNGSEVKFSVSRSTMGRLNWHLQL